MKLLSVHQFNAFKFMNLNIVDNRVELVEPEYNKVFALVDIFSSQIMSSNV